MTENVRIRTSAMPLANIYEEGKTWDWFITRQYY